MAQRVTERQLLNDLALSSRILNQTVRLSTKYRFHRAFSLNVEFPRPVYCLARN